MVLGSNMFMLTGRALLNILLKEFYSKILVNRVLNLTLGFQPCQNTKAKTMFSNTARERVGLCSSLGCDIVVVLLVLTKIYLDYSSKWWLHAIILCPQFFNTGISQVSFIEVTGCTF